MKTYLLVALLAGAMSIPAFAVNTQRGGQSGTHRNPASLQNGKKNGLFGTKGQNGLAKSGKTPMPKPTP